MRERKLQELKTGRAGRLQVSACDRQISTRICRGSPAPSRSTSDTPTGERALIQKRPNRAQLWQGAADSTLGGMKTPIPLDLRPGLMTGLSTALTAKEAGHD